MKFGSVAFFKRLIVAVFVLIVVTPLVLAVVFGTLYAGQKSRVSELEAAVQSLDGGALPALNTQASPPPEDANAPVNAPELEPKPSVDVLGPSFDYQTLYPELYISRPAVVPTEEKICYLTFDDGPSTITSRVLDTLKEEGILATFFVTGEAVENNPEILKRAVSEGHSIGVHTYSHDYNAIYASVADFLADFEKMYSLIVETTGFAPTIFRFAGGSINNYNMYVYEGIVAEMLRRGFTFFDWNAAGSDAISGGISSMEVTSNVLGSANGRQRAIVLLHDRADNTSTAAALPGIIRGLRDQGFAFAPLTNEVQPIVFYYQ